MKVAEKRRLPRERSLPTCKAALDTGPAEEPTGSEETERSHDGVGPQESLKESGGTSGSGVLQIESVNGQC